MSLLNGIASFTKSLEDRKIPYGIIGGLAVFAYGGERTTFDVDFLVDGQHREALLQLATTTDFKVIHENAEVVQLSGSVQIDVIFANRAATQAMLTRVHKIGKLPFPVVEAEDLIGLKIQGFVGDRSREFRDKGDILTILKNVQILDFKRIKEYADIFNVWPEIEDLKKRI